MRKVSPSKAYFPLLFSTGLSFVLVHFITLRWLYESVDGETLYGYGLPMPWFSWSMVSSMEFDVQIPYLTLNFIIYAVIIFSLLKLILKRLPAPKTWYIWKMRVFGILFIISSLAYISFLGKYYIYNRQLFSDNWDLKSVEFHFGLERSYNPR